MPSPDRTTELRPAELRRQMSEHVLYEIEQCASALSCSRCRRTQ